LSYKSNKNNLSKMTHRRTEVLSPIKDNEMTDGSLQTNK
jgi:hypothetical protein